MKMLITVDNSTKASITIEHGDKSLVFDISSFNKSAMVRNQVTEHINSYWSFLPMVKQQQIFDIYAHIRNVFEDHYSAGPLYVALMPLVKQLYDHHDIEDLRHWIAFHTNISVPNDIEESYVHSDEKPFSRERTYTKADYRHLVALVLSFRIMIPVWGEFIYRTGSETGTAFKEYYAFGLLGQARIMDSAAMIKLTEYIHGNLRPDQAIQSIIIGGVGSEDHTQWALGTLCVKRLSIGDISGADSNAHLVVTIYNDLDAKNTGSGTHIFGEAINKKTFEADKEDDQGTSRIENFKIKAEHSIGDISVIEHHTKNMELVARQLDPNADLSLLNEFYQAALVLQKEVIHPSQICVAQWIMSQVIPARGFYHLRKMSLIRILAIAQMWAWQYGHKKIAGLMTAISSDSSTVIQHSGIGSMARISKDQMVKLEELFPFNRVSSKRKNTTPANKAAEAIDIVAENLSIRDWILTMPDPYATELVGVSHHRRYGCPHDIKIALAKLAIECASRPTKKPLSDITN